MQKIPKPTPFINHGRLSYLLVNTNAGHLRSPKGASSTPRDRDVDGTPDKKAHSAL